MQYTAVFILPGKIPSSWWGACILGAGTHMKNMEPTLSVTFPTVFWWKDKSGDHRVLFWYQRSYRPHKLFEIWCDTKRQYPEGEFFFDQTKATRTEEWFTEKIGRIGDYQYDILPISFYDDRERPTTMLLTVCEEWTGNRRFHLIYGHIPMWRLKFMVISK